MNYRKLLYSGIIVSVVSPLIGLAGAGWKIYGSFISLGKNESAGIGAIGADIQGALIFSIIGIVGALVGIGMVIYAGVKLRKRL